MKVTLKPEEVALALMLRTGHAHSVGGLAFFRRRGIKFIRATEAEAVRDFLKRHPDLAAAIPGREAEG